MTTTPTATPVALSHEQIAEMLDLLKDSDSVELKLTVPEHDQRSAVVALGMDPLEAQIRQVFFFDTPDLALDKLGVVVRGRRIQGKGDDSVVKLRPVVPSELSEELRASTGFRVEVDALPGGFVCSGTLKRTLDSDEVRKTVAGERPVRKLFSKQQRAYFADACAAGSNWTTCRSSGRFSCSSCASRPRSSAAGSSPRCGSTPTGRACSSSRPAPRRTRRSRSRPRRGRSSASQGVDLSGEQETKTKKALEYFAGALKSGS